jgi:hypothetical protein
MQDDFFYCPIIKGKANDIRAMAYVAPAQATFVKPLYELPPFKPTDKPEEATAKFVSRLAKLAANRPCYVDFPMLKPKARTSDGESALKVALGQLNARQIPFEPVFGFDRDESLWPLIAEQTHRSGGLLLRLDIDDVDFADETIERILDLHRFGINTRQVDIMVDHRHLESREYALRSAVETADFIDNLATRARFRRLIVAGSCAPKSVAAVERDGYAAIPRHELSLWATLASERLPLRPIYSDYGIIHPDFSDLTLSTHINGKIRYTQGMQLHIHRGHSLRQGNKYEQYRVLASEVAKSSHYRGLNFSYGDRYIYDCATGHAGTGNPGTWVLVDQNHHIAFASDQMSRLATLALQGSNADAILQQA